MNKSERVLLQKLIEKTSQMDWGGWIRNAHYGWRFSFFWPPAKYSSYDVHLVGLSAILKDLLLRIEIRLFYIVMHEVPYFGTQRFDKEKDYFALELKLIDDLNRFGNKNVFQIYCETESEGRKMLLEIFERAQKKVNFFDRSGMKKKEVDLEKILDLI